ncbi:MAG: hypothetical protein DMF56_14420 [Acidobacteria bacterium]|nr:MAG: hypothetical protein DMF56_14420 [Acidobacteriota bacterium]
MRARSHPLHSADMKRMLLALALVAAGTAQAADSPASKYFSGITLTDQNGKRVALYDVMRGHTVVMYSFFANCANSCPLMAHSLTSLQKRFADHLGRDLFFVSITVDPEHDTPDKLKTYAARNMAKNGWIFLTGSREEINQALKKIGQYAETPDAHMNTMLIGNDVTGLWMKAQGLAKAEDLGDLIQKAIADKPAS